MKKITLVMAGAVLALSCIVSNAITNTAIAISGTNLVLYWPSYGYESYLVQYRGTLDPTDSWSQVVNAYPANTNQTTYTLYGLVSGSGSGGSVPHAAMMNAPTPPPGLIAIANDGSGAFPVEIFPPNTDFSGYELFDPETGTTMSGTNFSVPVTYSSTSATGTSGGASTNGPIPAGGSGGG